MQVAHDAPSCTVMSWGVRLTSRIWRGRGQIWSKKKTRLSTCFYCLGMGVFEDFRMQKPNFAVRFFSMTGNFVWYGLSWMFGNQSQSGPETPIETAIRDKPKQQYLFFGGRGCSSLLGINHQNATEVLARDRWYMANCGTKTRYWIRLCEILVIFFQPCHACILAQYLHMHPIKWIIIQNPMIK